MLQKVLNNLIYYFETLFSGNKWENAEVIWILIVELENSWSFDEWLYAFTHWLWFNNKNTCFMFDPFPGTKYEISQINHVNNIDVADDSNRICTWEYIIRYVCKCPILRISCKQ